MQDVEYADDEFLQRCVQAAITRYGAPDLINTDQAQPVHSLVFTQLLKDNGLVISMEGKGCWPGNVFVEWL